jgi:hypothetical protein
LGGKFVCLFAIPWIKYQEQQRQFHLGLVLPCPQENSIAAGREKVINDSEARAQ